MPTTPSLPKKIDRVNLDMLRSSFDQQNVQQDDSKKVFITSPLNSHLDYTTLQHIVAADFFRRLSGGSLLVSSNPALHHVHSSNPDIIRNARKDSLTEIRSLLNKLAVAPKKFLTTMDIDQLEDIHQHTQQFATDHQLAARWDVCYYNIYTATAVPDHRVVHKLVEGTRYHIRFFFGSKNDTIISVLNDPCLLFGCVALLVHPQDKRYKKLIGKEVIIPLINKSIPIVAHESVTLDHYGTHLLIPAHSREDFSLALELGLPYDIYAIDQYGYFTDVAKEFKGKNKDEFKSNIIQFIDDIANLEQKEVAQISIPTDSLTGDILLPLLQRNVYLSLSDGSLNDSSLVSHTQFAGISSQLQHEIEREEQWCLSSYDITQPYMPADLQNEDGSENAALYMQSIWYRLLRDMYLLDIVSLPAKGESIIQAFLFEINTIPVWKTLMQYYASRYSEEELGSYTAILSSLSNVTDQEYLSALDSILVILDNTPGIHYTTQGYVLDSQSIFRYDHEYLAVLLLCKQNDFSHIVALYDEKQPYWIKHSIYLYHKLYKQLLPDVSFVSLTGSNDSSYIQSSLQLYPGDVVRISLLSSISLLGEELSDVKTTYTNDHIYRFLTKWRNAMRVQLVTPSSELDLSHMDSIVEYFRKFEHELSDYDVWIITKIRYVWEEFNYYATKYSFSKAFQIVIDSLRYDISEWSLFILKFAPSKHTQAITSLAAYVSCHLLYPFAPTTAIGILSMLGLELNYDMIHQLFQTINLKKNYKCTLMMDAMMEWSHLVEQHVDNHVTEYSLCLQTNKDFSDYLLQHHDFVVTYFGGTSKVRLQVLHELEQSPDGWLGTDLLTMKVGIVPTLSTPVSSTEDMPLPPTISISVLQGQLAYKKQLLQTMRNTIMRLRSSSGQQSGLPQLQNDVDLLQREIDQLEYQISKMKYF